MAEAATREFRCGLLDFKVGRVTTCAPSVLPSFGQRRARSDAPYQCWVFV
jgi:hypothetical protein